MAAESKLENKIRKYAEQHGMLFKKFISPGWTGVPDRILFAPRGEVFLAELKAPDGDLSPRQIRVHKDLRDLGFRVLVWDDYNSAVDFIDRLFRLNQKTGISI